MAKMRAAVRQVLRRGWCEAKRMRRRRVLHTTDAPILSSVTRIVAAVARARSVSARAIARRRSPQRVSEGGKQQAQPVGEKVMAAGTGAQPIELRFLEAIFRFAAEAG